MKTIGYIKLFRSLLAWEWYDDANTLRVFLHLLLTCRYEDDSFEGKAVPRGSGVYSVAKLAKDLNMSARNVRTALEHLESTGEIQLANYSRFQIVTVNNFEKFQKRTRNATPISAGDKVNDKPNDKLNDKVNDKAISSEDDGMKPFFEDDDRKSDKVNDKVNDKPNDKVNDNIQRRRKKDEELYNNTTTTHFVRSSSGHARARARLPLPERPEIPTREDVIRYAEERQSRVDPVRFFEVNASRGWNDKEGCPIADWKALFRVWETTERVKQADKPMIDLDDFSEC